MTHLDVELNRLKSKMNEMWFPVEFQVVKGKDAFFNFDKELAIKIIKNGKKVNKYELKIDTLCENFIALFNPVAVDLRLVLATLRINTNLERIGDIAEGIAQIILSSDKPFDTKLIEVSQVETMYNAAIEMFADVQSAFDKEDATLARGIFEKDKFLDDVKAASTRVIGDYIKSDCENVEQGLHIYNMIIKIERIGDQLKNIAEEIIFYIDAQVVKHNKAK